MARFSPNKSLYVYYIAGYWYITMTLENRTGYSLTLSSLKKIISYCKPFDVHCLT